MHPNTVTVSVCMITYNHEKFIKKAIEGVLMQEGDFKLDLVISNDCSSDNTNKIILSIIKNHPLGGKIRYFNQTENLGMMPNFLFTLNKCKGKYIALCDGDDFWLDNKKIQKQVAFLEKNKNYIACFHNAKIIQENRVLKYYTWDKDRVITTREIIVNGGGIYPTSSFLYKNIPFKIKASKYIKAGDTLLIFHLLDKGGFYYLKDIMSVYRKHVGGIYTSIHNNRKKIFYDIISNLKMLKFFRKRLPIEYYPYFNDAIEMQLNKMSNKIGYKGIVKSLLMGAIHISFFMKITLKKIRTT